jgi:hypothetical protein
VHHGVDELIHEVSNSMVIVDSKQSVPELPMADQDEMCRGHVSRDRGRRSVARIDLSVDESSGR